ncbi:MAG: hypothetical protein RJA63_2202 [Pseudomonadota bacterium]|jgi:hypothetical protein
MHNQDDPIEAASACSEFLESADPDRIGCGTRNTGLGPIAWLLVGLLGFVLVMATAHFAARWWL